VVRSSAEDQNTQGVVAAAAEEEDGEEERTKFILHGDLAPVICAPLVINHNPSF
jgi:hypothetical protein